MFIQFLLKDVLHRRVTVKLRVTIEGMGITLRTKPAYQPPALILQGGVPEMLTGADLRHYLNPDNLDFSGISRQEFMKRGTFPEGFYTFRVEVLDYVRNVVVSNPGFANAWMIMNDPPLINFPTNHEKVTATDPQNVMFNWTPLHSGSPNAAFTTEYEFTLVELYPEGRNPNDALRVAKPIFVTTTPSTSLNYGAMEPLLIPGRKYAFRVRAFDTSKRDLFKNNGFSEVFVFQFGDACVAPLNIKSEALDPNRIKLSWEPTEAHTSFIVQYKRQGGKEWEETTTYSNSVIIPGLQGGTTYQYQVSGSCGTIRGELSALASITTPTTKEDEFSCGAPSPAIEINTNPLIEDLKVDDLIKTADFEVSLTSVEKNQDGSYKGTGRAFLPWLNLASVQVKFSGIRVNEEYRVYAGNVTTVYSKNSRFVAHLDLADEMKEDKKNSGSKETQKDKDEKFEGIEIPYEGDIETITVNPVTGEIVIANADGTTTVLPREKNKETDQYEDVRITDSNGDKWVINSNGNVTQEPSSTPPNAIASADSIDFTVRFAAHPDQHYGFDQKKDDNLGKYDIVKIRDQDYTIFWKSLETGQQDFVNAVADGKDTFPRIVGFRNSFGENASMPGTAQNEKQIIIVGQSKEEQALTAYVKVKEDGKEETEIEVGKLKVATYDKVRNKVIIVPVNDATAQDGVTLANAINSIFKQAVAEWDVTVEERFIIDQEKLVGLDAGESGLLASFPAKCRDFNREFKEQRDIDKDAYYLFLIRGSGSSRSGFMPFKRKFGYIFIDNLGSLSLSTTIAHELAHGAFRLRHTFSPEAFMAAEGSTDNLMDYKGGTELKKYQWDYVHDPESMNGWLQDDDESAHYNLTTIDVWTRNLNEIACAKSRGLTEASVNVYYKVNNNGYTADITPIKFNYNNIEVEVLVNDLPGINKYVANISSKSISTQSGKTIITYALNGSSKRIKFRVASDKATQFDALISSPSAQFFQQMVNAIPLSEGDDAYSAISRLSTCALELISDDKRMTYIDWMINREIHTNKTQEEMIIDLLENIASNQVKTFVNNKLEKYPRWEALFESFDEVSTHQGLFRAILRLYQTLTPSKEEQSNIKAVFDFNMLNHTSLTFDYTSRISVNYSAGRLHFFRDITTANWTPYGLNNVNNKTTSHAELNLFAPVLVILNDDHKNIGLQPGTELRSIPAILAAFFIEKRNSEYNKQLASTALDVGLLAFGIDEISIALKTYQTASNIRNLFRLTLATADFATAYLDLVCQSGDAELCKKWKEISFYVQIGLLSTNVLSNLEDLITTTKNVSKVSGKLDDLLKNTSYKEIFDPLDKGLHIRKYADLMLQLQRKQH